VTVVADSGALYALYDADDRHHDAVKRAVAAARGPILVPAVLLAEVDYLLREYLGIDAELDFLASLADGAFVLEHFLPPDLARARELVEQYRSLDLGLADAVVVATAERLHVPTILTVDERDFRVVRHRSGASFTLWPADMGPV
jgi:predicted nucleic acid-binding protein